MGEIRNGATQTMAIDLQYALRTALDMGGEENAIAYAGSWRSRDWVKQAVHDLDAAIGDGRSVGLIARNRPHLVATCVANIAAGRSTAMIYAAQSERSLAAEITKLRVAAVVADEEDWTEELLAAARFSGSAAIATSEQSGQVAVKLLAPRGERLFRDVGADVAMELLSSGTTGAPKRIALKWHSINSAVKNAGAAYAGSAARAPQIMVHPLGNVAGLAYAVPPLVFGKPLVLIDRFTAHGWAEAVRDYQPARGTVPPAGIKMLLDADIPREWLASLSLIAVGGGKLDSQMHDAFERRFGIPILLAYGATEFGGVVANWSLDEYKTLGPVKRGSVGRASKGVQMRVVDADTGGEMLPDEIGLLEAQVARIGPDWIRTNDLAALDEDGFLFLHGRADSAINRGGFKVVPEMVADVLRQHEDVSEVAVVGIPDERLGEVPVAAVECEEGATTNSDALKAWLKDRLVAYEVPVDIRVVDALPRNESFKISVVAVKKLFAGAVDD